MRQTVILRVNPEEPEIDKIRVAADAIRRGGLVAFPTETVYGLGADALNQKAVAQIYTAKKRPLDNPIIVHVASREEVYKLSESVPERANRLIDNFWPGPLTLVLKASKTVPKATTGGLDTVAMRMPSHTVALALIRESKVPIAAPSANLSGRPSPTTAEHVRQDLGGRIDVILDAGSTMVGIESTVLDLTVDPPQVLRPGGVPYEELGKILGRVELHPVAIADRRISVAQVRSPGMKHRHYAPRAQLMIVEGSLEAIIPKVQELTTRFLKKGKKVGILATDESESRYSADVVKSLGSRKDLATTARNLFRLLREFDMEKVDIIIAEGIATEGLGLAVMNRLRKASSFNTVRAD
ncbi:MAG: L-threonylcarbamoyladenylate synthase [Candidatus Bathyarchaeota archaeon]|nr:L-threonylcarbamoyladenylate synthase [Candidatus Bathyarchaeota archaeon]